MVDSKNNESIKNELEKIYNEYKKEIGKLEDEQSIVIGEFIYELEEKRKKELRENLTSTEK
jgi:hypothetical protein